MKNKSGLITPFFMLLAGAIAAIIMYVRHFDLMTSLVILLLVLVIFYILGDTLRYIYVTIRPRIIPDITLEDVGMEYTVDSVVAKDTPEEQEAAETEDESGAADGQDAADDAEGESASGEEGYSDEDL